MHIINNRQSPVKRWVAFCWIYEDKKLLNIFRDPWPMLYISYDDDLVRFTPTWESKKEAYDSIMEEYHSSRYMTLKEIEKEEQGFIVRYYEEIVVHADLVVGDHAPGPGEIRVVFRESVFELRQVDCDIDTNIPLEDPPVWRE